MCSLPTSLDRDGRGEMIARELFDPLLACLFFFWASYDIEQYSYTSKKGFISRYCKEFLANMISALAGEKKTHENKW